MTWYQLIEFRCPGCGQRLAVERAQVERHEEVTCQDCNTDIVVLPRDLNADVAAREAEKRGYKPVRLKL